MNKIVLIYPKIKGDFHWFPWSLLGMAQILKDNGYDVVEWDERVQGEDELFKALEGALFACISIMIGEQITNALNIAKKITVPIVWGRPTIKVFG